MSIIKHTNEFSRNNYTCNYYNEESLSSLSRKHHKSSLKIIHLNIESYKKNGPSFLFFLKCLHSEFDIVCLTETRQTTIGIIEKEFPDFHIFIDNPKIEKGGAAVLIRKKQIF